MPHLMIPVSEVQAGSRHMESRTGRINLFNVLSLCWALNKGVVCHTQLQDYIQHHPTVSKQGQVLKKNIQYHSDKQTVLDEIVLLSKIVFHLFLG
jgi:hypothetical protein